MSGVIKTVGKIAGVVASVALALPTGGTSLALAASALAIGSSLLAGRAKAPATSPASDDRLKIDIDPNTPRKFVFGTTAMATDIRDQEYSDDQTQLHRFVVTAAHRVKRIREIWFDDKLAWSEAGGITADYLGYLGVECYADGSPAHAKNISARMGASRRFTGCAWVYLRYKLTGNSKKAESPFAQSVPTRVTIVGDGAYVYDPRLDSTVPGGSGACRANDQSTWVWSENAARNPALQLLWYLLGWRIQNPATGEWRLSCGKGIPARYIDLPSFITAANMCDEPVALAGGGAQPRYRSDGLFSEADATSTVTDQLKAAMNADLDDVDGKLRLTVLHNDLGTPAVDLTTDDVIGAFKWEQTPPLDEMRNVVRGTYVDPSNASLYQSLDYPEVRIASPDGIDRIDKVDFQTVQDARQAQRLVKQRIARAGYAGTFTATFSHKAWRARKGDPIRLTFAPRGWTNKLFRVGDTAVQVDGRVPMVLIEEHPDIYLWDADERPAIQAVQPTTYDPYLNPLVQAIDEVEVGDPAYSDGTPIDDLRPAEPGATVGASPAERDQLDDQQTAIAAHDAAIAAAEAARAAMQDQIDLIASSIGDGEIDLSELTARIVAAEGSITTINTTIGTQGASITTLQTAADTTAGTLATHTTQIETANSAIAANATAISTANTNIADLTISLGAVGSTVTSHASAISTLTGQQATLASDVATANANASSALTATSTMEGDVATLKNQVRAGGGNLLLNSAFAGARSDGWNFGAYGGMVAGWSVNGGGNDWRPTGENVLTIGQANAGTAGYAEWSTTVNIESLKWYEVQVRTGLHRTTGKLYLVYLDAANGAVPGGSHEIAMDPGYPGGTSLSMWGAAHIKAQAPAGAVRAWIVLRKFGTATGSDSYLFAARPQLSETLAASSSPLPYAPASDAATVTQAFTALSYQDGQLAEISSAVTVQGAAVSEHATALTDLEGKTAAWWGAEAIAGSDRAKIRLFAGGGYAGFDIDGDLRVTGNALIGGTVNPEALALSRFIKRVTASGTGSPSTGASLLLAEVALGDTGVGGEYILSVGATFTTNVGRQTGTHLGRPLYTNYLPDGGLIVRLVKGGITIAEHSYAAAEFGTTAYASRLVTHSDVLNFDAPDAETAAGPVTLQIWAMRGGGDTGIVDEGDYYQRDVSASYSAFDVLARCKWTLI